MIFISGGGNYKQTAVLDNLFFGAAIEFCIFPSG